MRCVVYSKCELPEFRGIRGPIMSPTELDPQLIMKWLYVGLDVREVMPDGSHRRLKTNDEKLVELLNKKYEEKQAKRLGIVKANDNKPKQKEVKQQPKKEVPKAKPYEKKVKPVELPKEEPKVEQPKEDIVVNEPAVHLPIDNLEKPE